MKRLLTLLGVLLVAHVALLFVRPRGASSAQTRDATQVGIVFDVGGRGDKSFNDGAYLGAFSVPRASDEGAAFLEAVEDAQRATPGRPSIVNGSIAAAMAGRFGDAQFTERTAGSELFINPLMGLYFTFDLEGVARRSRYLPQLEGTETIFEVGAVIEAFRRGVEPRARRAIPH